MNGALKQLAQELELSDEHLLKLARDISANKDLVSLKRLTVQQKEQLVAFLGKAKAYREAHQLVMA